jgi:hypothetical protein
MVMRNTTVVHDCSRLLTPHTLPAQRLHAWVGRQNPAHFCALSQLAGQKIRDFVTLHKALAGQCLTAQDFGHSPTEVAELILALTSNKLDIEQFAQKFNLKSSAERTALWERMASDRFEGLISSLLVLIVADLSIF